MLKKVFQKLDRWMEESNKERWEAGTLRFQPVMIRLLGQMALVEAQVDLDLFATVDVDAYMETGSVRMCLEELLKEEGLILDPDADKIWMPEETEYRKYFKGKLVEVVLAEPDYVLISKALKAPKKNGALIAEYLAGGASAKFQKMAEKYKLDLEQFL